MTKEEAIEYLFDLKTDAVYRILPVEKEAIDMAIEALEEYPKVADALNGEVELYRKKKAQYDELKKQNQWIPCEERLPEETGRYLCTYIAEDGVRCVDFGKYTVGEGWYISGETAWMPLPKPYEGRTE